MPGDAQALEQLAKRIGELAKGSAQKSIVKAIANAAIAQSLGCFRESRDPYGTAWAPLKSRNGKPLLRTGRLRSSIAVQESGDASFRIGSNVRYAVFHQQGVDKVFKRKARTQEMLRRARGKKAGQFVKFNTKIRGENLTASVLRFAAKDVHITIPRRQFIPDRGFLGPIWAKAFVDAGNLALTRILGASNG